MPLILWVGLGRGMQLRRNLFLFSLPLATLLLILLVLSPQSFAYRIRSDNSNETNQQHIVDKKSYYFDPSHNSVVKSHVDPLTGRHLTQLKYGKITKSPPKNPDRLSLSPIFRLEQQHIRQPVSRVQVPLFSFLTHQNRNYQDGERDGIVGGDGGDEGEDGISDWVKKKRSGFSSSILNTPILGTAVDRRTEDLKRSRPYDVPQIECPLADDGMERFACPTPDSVGRYRCVDDHVLCDGFIDCPNAEDEDRQACLFYKTTKAHLDVLADALLRWARG